MSELTHPDTIAAMLADPDIPITRYDFEHRINPNFSTGCRLFYVPTQAPVNPGPVPAAPIPPVPLGPNPRGRPTKARKAALTAYQTATITYQKAAAAYPAVAAAHAAQLATYQAYIAKVEKEGGEVEVRPDPDFIFTHGRGTRLDAPAIVAFTEGYARTQCMLAFEDVRSHNERASTFRSLLNDFPSVKALGGRSMGAQASVRAQLYGPAKKLILFSYPLVSGMKIRSEELAAIEEDVDVLFIVGDEDPKAQEIQFREARKRMRCRTWWMKVEKGDHSLFFSAAFPSKRQKICNVVGQIAARWDLHHDPERTEMVVGWEGDDENGHPVWTEWLTPKPEAPKPNTVFNVSLLGPHLPSGGGSFTFALPQ